MRAFIVSSYSTVEARAVFYGSGNQSEFAATSDGMKAFGIKQTSAVFWTSCAVF
jgi:hypothetical protein